jgi:uncharacterized protein YjbJ (UPF0337 family)
MKMTAESFTTIIITSSRKERNGRYDPTLNYEDTMMNKDEIGGNWKQFKGKAKEKWGKLTDDDMTVIEGKRDQLVGKIQERYGYAKDQAENEVKDWETRNDYRW